MKRSVKHVLAVLVGVLGLIVTGPSLGVAAKPVPAPTITLVEIVGTTIPLTPTVVYTVPAGSRLILTDIKISACPHTLIFRDQAVVAHVNPPTERSYESGIEFGPGHTVGLSLFVTTGSGEGCSDHVGFYELRGILETQ